MLEHQTKGAALSGRCCEVGRFVHKDACFALETSEGDFWLEMDRIPMDLIEREVRVEGRRFPPNVLLVEEIALADKDRSIPTAGRIQA